MNKAELLRSLREQTSGTAHTPKEIWPAPKLLSGVARGIVAELIGNARTEWLIQFFCAHPEPFIFWCEREPTLNPTALHQRGLNLERVLFAQVADELPKVLHRTLETGHYPFIVAPNRNFDVKALQRLHLLAGKSKSTLFLLAEQKLSQAWPISLQLEINSATDDFDVHIHRQKYSGEP